MNIKFVAHELNNHTTSQISDNIRSLIKSMIKKVNELSFISNSNNKSNSLLIKALFILSFKISNRITSRYIEIIKDISDFLKSEHIDELYAIIQQNRIESYDAIELTRNFIKQTKNIIDIENIILELILNIIAYDTQIDDQILYELINILTYDENINNTANIKNILKEFDVSKKKQLVNDYLEELYLLVSRFDDANRGYFENYLRSCAIILYLSSNEFSIKTREILNSILKQFNLIEIDDEIDQYFKKNGLENNRFKAMLNSAKFYIDFYSNSDMTILDLVYKIFLIALNLNNNMSKSLEQMLNELTLKGGKRNEFK